MNVLVLNSGSSSLKFQVIATDLERIKQYKDDRVCKGEVEGIGGEAIIHIRYRDQPSKTLTAPIRDMSAALDHIVRYIGSEQSGVPEIKSYGRRACCGSPRGAWRRAVQGINAGGRQGASRGLRAASI